MSKFSPATEMSSDEIKEAAEWRWKAVEAFLAIGLSPLASRLGVKLIAMMNSKTRLCYPSEVRLAAELGCSTRAIQKAKAELRVNDLLVWETPMGRRGGSYYTFNFELLGRIHVSAKAVGDTAVKQQMEANRASSYMPKRRLKASSATDAKASNSKSDSRQHEALLGLKPPIPVFNPNNGAVQPEQIDTPTRTMETFNPNTASYDITQYITQYTLPYHHDVRKTNAAMGDAIPKAEISKPKKPRCHFQRLVREFGINDELADQIATLDYSVLDQADRTFAMQGREASARYLRLKGVPVIVETLQ